MNRFRTKKKAKDGSDIAPTPSNDSEVAVPILPNLKNSKTFRKNKKNMEEEKCPLELDLSTALPSTDDFRTSLLMNGLSARFSMLREQDDPSSKLGKASDDSVLFPKRQSRFDLFNGNGLSDIAEVASINGSIRPPFASYDRHDSSGGSADGYGTDDDAVQNGNIMSRSRRREGNNVFGGRQKIYKIPARAAASMKNLGDSAGTGMGGRILYDDDVGQSAFQRIRQQQREEERQQQMEEETQQMQEETQQQGETGEGEDFPITRSNSPPLLGYNQNRETSSTTSSRPYNTRTSTAATSVSSRRTPSLSGRQTPTISPNLSGKPSSEGLNGALIKNRRLYETGLDQHLHDQQSSAMHRLDTISRRRVFDNQTPPPGPNSPSEFQGTRKPSLQSQRAASPGPYSTPYSGFEFGTKSTGVERKASLAISPPLSPHISEDGALGQLPIQPGDRGKATATGAFSKPAQAYDENKYRQRQLAMQQGRETPPLRQRSPSVAYVPRPMPQRQRSATFASAASAGPQSPSLPQSTKQLDPPPENQYRQPQDTLPEEPPSATFLHSPNGSSVSSMVEQESGTPWNRPLSPTVDSNPVKPNAEIEPPPQSEHPANRRAPGRLWADYTSEADALAAPPVSIPNPSDNANSAPMIGGLPMDSPTLGPVTGISDLSGLVMGHLRSDSGASSVYGMNYPNMASQFSSRPPSSGSVGQSQYNTKGNPWDAMGWDQAVDENANDVSAPEPLSDRSPKKSALSPAHDTNRAPSNNSRDDSIDEFANQLAARRLKVQQKLKSIATFDNRDPSPPLFADYGDENMNAPRKVSGDSLALRSKESGSGQSKAMKMLGLAGASDGSDSVPPTRSSPRPSVDDLWKNEEQEMLRPVAKTPRVPPGIKNIRQARRDAQRDRERQVFERRHGSGLESPEKARRPEPISANSQHSMPPLGYENELQSTKRSTSSDRKASLSADRKPSLPQVVHAQSQENKVLSTSSSQSGSRPASRAARDRSSSSASGRSKSRNGRYRDDLAKAMAEGTSSSAMGILEDSTMTPLPSLSLNSRSSVATSEFGGRSRASSKSGYFDSKPVSMPPTPDLSEIGLSPRRSPVPAFSANATPPLSQPTPSPSMATASSGGQGFQGNGPPRKFSVNKSTISEPTLISYTPRINTVDLPPGSSLTNSPDSNAPPVPPINPRRRQTRTHAMFSVFSGRSSDSVATAPVLPTSNSYRDNSSQEEVSTFSGDEGDDNKFKQKLRKSNSEAGNLNVRARAAMFEKAPAMPSGRRGMF